jgi:predicted nucleic acid-binding protein
VRLVIADTGPVNYLILIGCIDLLPRLFEKTVVPIAVKNELSDPRTPLAVRNWIASPPAWLEVHDASSLPKVSGLDVGETEAIALAENLRADLLLVDERIGFRMAKKMGLRVTGTLGLLDMAADHGLVNFGAAVQALEKTTFRRPETLLEALLKKHSQT